MLKFECLLNDENDKLYISQKLNNGDFDYRMAIKTFELPDSNDVCVEILSVSNDEYEANNDDLNEGLNDNLRRDISFYSKEDIEILKCEVLISWGETATLDYKIVDAELLEQTFQEQIKYAEFCKTMFGFFMDKPQNGVGKNGWDFIRGQVV